MTCGLSEQVSRQFARAEVDASAEQGKWET